MKVSEWMQKDMPVAGLDSSVTEVARMMIEGHTGCVPIVDAQRKLLGVVTEQDLIVKHAHLHFPTYIGLLGFTLPFETAGDDREIEKALATTAGQLMTRAVRTLRPDVDIDEAATLMVDEGISCVPITQGGILMGLVTRTDIVRLLVVEEG